MIDYTKTVDAVCSDCNRTYKMEPRHVDSGVIPCAELGCYGIIHRINEEDKKRMK